MPSVMLPRAGLLCPHYNSYNWFQASDAPLQPEPKTVGLLPLPSPMLPRSSKGMEALLNSTEEGHINTEVPGGALVEKGGALWGMGWEEGGVTCGMGC